jgi:RNA polymerase sigma factor (sigma-70 family)
MSQVESPFTQAIQRMCSGSQEAVFDFIEVYGPHIQRVVRSRLNQSLRVKFDSVDFVQMVWMSLFTDITKLANFQHPAELIAYLVAIARNKVVEESRRRMKYQKYNIRRESSLETLDQGGNSVSGRSDTPSQELMARERFDEILNGKSERDRQVFHLRLAGATFVEIAAKLAISERTARQIMTEIKQACCAKSMRNPPEST